MIAAMNKKTGINPIAALLLTGMWYIINLLTHCRNKEQYQTALELLVFVPIPAHSGNKHNKINWPAFSLWIYKNCLFISGKGSMWKIMIMNIIWVKRHFWLRRKSAHKELQKLFNNQYCIYNVAPSAFS